MVLVRVTDPRLIDARETETLVDGPEVRLFPEQEAVVQDAWNGVEVGARENDECTMGREEFTWTLPRLLRAQTPKQRPLEVGRETMRHGEPVMRKEPNEKSIVASSGPLTRGITTSVMRRWIGPG